MFRRGYCKRCGVRLERVDPRRYLCEWRHPRLCTAEEWRGGRLLDDPLVHVVTLRERLVRAATLWFFFTVPGLVTMAIIGVAMWLTLPLWILVSVWILVADRRRS